MSETEQKCSKCGEAQAEGAPCDCHVTRSDILPAEIEEMFSAARHGRTEEPSSGATLVDKESGEQHALLQSVIKIGRDRSNNISLPNDSYSSRHHAWILFIKGNYFVEDLGSTNGTLLNGEVLSERKQIFPGDRIKFGRTELVFEIN